MTGREQIISLLKEVADRTPAVIMGDGVKEFMSIYKKQIRAVRTADDLRELLAYYHSISVTEYPLVIEDISFVPRTAHPSLLKFLEETKLDVILLSTFDVFDSVILSRIKTIIKYRSQATKSEFLPVSVGQERINEELEQDTSEFDRMQRVVRYSPLIYYYDKKLAEVYNKKKILQILGV